MRGILSLGALHLACLCPERKDVLLELSASYHELFSRSAVSQMQNIQESNKVHLFIFSVLTIYIGKHSCMSFHGID
jgi:hypothetical protein